jgi:hypothetical protein
MINPFNVSDSKIANLRGNHYAEAVYCKKLVKHEGDPHYAWLECQFVLETDEKIDPASCAYEDRIYEGELHIRGIYGIDEQGSTETEEPADIYPRGE